MVEYNDSQLGFIWIYGLVVLFATGVIEIVIMPAVEYRMVPQMLVVGNNTLPVSEQMDYANHILTTVRLMHIVPYAIMLVILIYMIIASFKREQVDYYQ